MAKNKSQQQTKIYEADIDLIFELVQADLHDYLKKIFMLRGKSVVSTEEFLYVPGRVPILLIAHLDTVHKDPPTICRSRDGEFMMAPQGIGGDDRAGVWIVMETLKSLDCHVLFTHDEETGGGGATAFTRSGILPDVNFIIEPDRQGDNDAVFYECGNLDFIEMVTEATGYKETFGSFSDISIIAPFLNRAAVNLSSGYFRPHLTNEYVKFSGMKKTVAAILNLIADERSKTPYTFDAVVYKYKGRGTAYSRWDDYLYDDDDYWSKGKYITRGTPTALSQPSTTSVTIQKTAGGNLPPTATVPAPKVSPMEKSPEEEDEEEEDLMLELDDTYLEDECRHLIYKLTGYWMDGLVVTDVADAVREVLETYWAYPIR